ncbi:MAG TPA: alpha/beta hydrolase [Actinomycetota bacterium]|nr:alpha/beta hydrolase [Actinomycetota bacterium]
MGHVSSKDGTHIAFDRLGSGPPVVLVGGGSTDRTANAPLADLLARRFTVINYDRRGRADSGDTPPYRVQREVEDIEALFAETGGTACLYGTSSGGALALEAAASGVPVTKLAMWEPPFSGDESVRPPLDQVERYHEMIAEGRRSDAVEYFMSKVVRLPDDFVAYARTQPFWAAQEALAHTLAYDATIMGDYSIPSERAARVDVPTLVLAGGADIPWMRDTARALADALPRGEVKILEGQGHDVDQSLIAEALTEFFEG